MYNVDFKDLLDVSLSATELFRACGADFVISGCDYDSANGVVNAGYVWLSGKIRKIESTPVASANMLRIIVSDSDGESINYADGTAHKRNSIFGAEVVNSTSNEGIAFDGTVNRFPNLADVFFNYYALVKNAASQTVNAVVKFNKRVDFGNNGAVIQNGTSNTSIYVDSSGKLCLKVLGTVGGAGVVYKMSDSGVVSAYSGSDVLWSINGNDGTVSVSNLVAQNVTADDINTQNINVSDSAVIQNATVSETASAKNVNVTNKATVKTLSVNTAEIQDVTAQSAKANTLNLLGNGALNPAVKVNAGYIDGLRGRINIASTNYTITPSDYIVLSAGTTDLFLPNFTAEQDGAMIIIINSDLVARKRVRGRITTIVNGSVNNYTENFPLEMAPTAWTMFIYSHALGYWLAQNIHN